MSKKKTARLLAREKIERIAERLRNLALRCYVAANRDHSCPSYREVPTGIPAWVHIARALDGAGVKFPSEWEKP